MWLVAHIGCGAHQMSSMLYTAAHVCSCCTRFSSVFFCIELGLFFADYNCSTELIVSFFCNKMFSQEPMSTISEAMQTRMFPVWKKNLILFPLALHGSLVAWCSMLGNNAF